MRRQTDDRSPRGTPKPGRQGEPFLDPQRALDRFVAKQRRLQTHPIGIAPVNPSSGLFPRPETTT